MDLHTLQAIDAFFEVVIFSLIFLVPIGAIGGVAFACMYAREKEVIHKKRLHTWRNVSFSGPVMALIAVLSLWALLKVIEKIFFVK